MRFHRLEVHRLNVEDFLFVNVEVMSDFVLSTGGDSF